MIDLVSEFVDLRKQKGSTRQEGCEIYAFYDVRHFCIRLNIVEFSIKRNSEKFRNWLETARGFQTYIIQGGTINYLIELTSYCQQSLGGIRLNYCSLKLWEGCEKTEQYQI